MAKSKSKSESDSEYGHECERGYWDRETVRLPWYLRKRLYQAVEDGEFANKSEALREGLKMALRERGRL